MRNRFYEVAGDLVMTNENIAVVLADIGVSGMPEHERIINVGIREQLMVGMAAGLALEGFRPIIHSYTPFAVERPFDQLKLDLGHQGVGAIIVSVGASYDAAFAGRTHQAPEDVALMATLPGWTVHVPGHPDEVEELLRSAAQSSDLVYMRLDGQSNSEAHGQSGGIETLRFGSLGTVLAAGPMLDPILEATEDIDVTVLYTNTVRPFRAEAFRAAATAERLVLAEPYLEGTSAGEISKAMQDLPHRLLSIGYRLVESRAYGSPEDHRKAHGLEPSDLRLRIEGFLSN